jgi:hypothetical protein
LGIIISAEACLGIADPDFIQQYTAGASACGFFLGKRYLSPRRHGLDSSRLKGEPGYEKNV